MLLSIPRSNSYSYSYSSSYFSSSRDKFFDLTILCHDPPVSDIFCLIDTSNSRKIIQVWSYHLLSFLFSFSVSLPSIFSYLALLIHLYQCYFYSFYFPFLSSALLYTAYLRVARGVIDLGAFVLRLVLWIKYGSVSSVFLIKNLYNLLHTASQIERWSGVWRYPKHTLFTEFVSPADWYGMTKEEWRIATSNTLVAQARAGRRVWKNGLAFLFCKFTDCSQGQQFHLSLFLKNFTSLIPRISVFRLTDWLDFFDH